MSQRCAPWHRHFHIDHAAGLPVFTERMQGFKGRIFATHPTVAVMRMLLSDSVHLVSRSADSAADVLYTEEDVVRCVDRIECVDFKQTISVEGITFTLYNAGHVLGAAMAMVTIGGVRVLYTGDYSCEEDRHLMAASVPAVMRQPDILISECTFGMAVHRPRLEREKEFTSMVRKVVQRGGRCLIPVFALGRAQELLLLLEEYWAATPEVQHIPVFFASNLAAKSLEVYRTYTSHMNAHIATALTAGNPWEFKHIQVLRSQSQFHCTGPCVVMASPGMLQHGFSRALFDQWAEDERNGVIVAGYNVEGTLARTLMENPKEVPALSGRMMHLRADVQAVSFTAHADGAEARSFIDTLQPGKIVLVHGESKEMSRLHAELQRLYSGRAGFGAYMPANTQSVEVLFQDSRLVKALGQVASRSLAPSMPLQGILVAEHFDTKLLAPADVPTFTQLQAQRVAQRQHMPFWASFAALTALLTRMFDSVHPVEQGVSTGGDAETSVYGAGSAGGDAASAAGAAGKFATAATVDSKHTPDEAVLVDGVVQVERHLPDRLILVWDASPLADSIADSIMALAASVEVSPLNLTLTKAVCTHSHGHDDSVHDHTGCAQRTALRVPDAAQGDAGDGSKDAILATAASAPEGPPAPLSISQGISQHAASTVTDLVCKALQATHGEDCIQGTEARDGGLRLLVSVAGCRLAVNPATGDCIMLSDEACTDKEVKSRIVDDLRRTVGVVRAAVVPVSVLGAKM